MPPHDSIPERLGDFRLLERLGAGGMGVVYLARQESLARDVALKLILPEHLYFAEARERFRREVEAAAKLRHPGIVPVYSVGEEAGLPYYAMELIDGASLADVLDELRGRRPNELTGADLRRAVCARSRRSSDSSSSGSDGGVFVGTWAEACCRVVLQVADALQHAHERGVLHRDVKPSNIVITPTGRAMLLDFGLASHAESSRITRTGAQVGSLPYMPPENLQGGASADRRGDVYSLGVALYEMLALRLPFEGPSVQHVMAAIEAGSPSALRLRNGTVSWDVAVVCETAMERDLRRRYASMATLAVDLRNVLEKKPIRARAPTRSLRARRWVQRHPTASVAIVLGALLFGAAPSVAWWRIRKERDVALRELRAKEGMFDFMIGLFQETDPALGNPADQSVYELIERGTRRVETEFRDLPEIRGELLIELSIIHGKLGHPREALAKAREALELVVPTHGEGSRQAYRARHEIAVALMDLGEVEEASRMLAELRADAERGGSITPYDLVDLQIDLAGALILQGEFDEAERALTELAAQREREQWNPTTEMNFENGLGQIQRYRGDMDGAIEHFQRALERLRAAYGPVHTDIARMLQNIAVAYTDSSRNEKALPFLIEARDVRARVGAGESTEDVRLEFNLGIAYSRLARLDEATECLARALELSRKLAGDSAQTARSAAGLGSILCKAGRYEEALPILTEALDLSRRFIPQQGLNAIDAPIALGRCLVKLERPQEALPHYEEVAPLLGEDSSVRPDLAAKLSGEHGELLRSLGREAEAAACFERQRSLAESAAARSH